MIVLYVYDELSYDKFNTNADRIYRVNNDIKIGNIQLDLDDVTPLCLMTGKENSSITIRLSAQDIAPVIARIKKQMAARSRWPTL